MAQVMSLLKPQNITNLTSHISLQFYWRKKDFRLCKTIFPGSIAKVLAIKIILLAKKIEVVSKNWIVLSNIF